MTDIKKMEVQSDAKRVLGGAIDQLMKEHFDPRDTSKDELDTFVEIYDWMTDLSPPFITSTRCGHMVMDEDNDSKAVISKVSFQISNGGVGNKDAYLVFNFDKDGKFVKIHYETDNVLAPDYVTLDGDNRRYDAVMDKARPFAEWLSDQFRFYS